MGITIEIDKGQSIYNAATEAIDLAKILRSDVTFVFNDINLRAYPYSCEEDIAHIYELKLKIQRMEANGHSN